MRDRVVWCDKGWMPLSYGFCPSERAWKRELKRLEADETYPYPTTDAGTTFVEGPHKGVIVTLNERFDKERDRVGVVCLLVHEATHVWQAIREDIGEHKPSHEFEAYAMQNISMNLIQAYNDTRRKIL